MMKNSIIHHHRDLLNIIIKILSKQFLKNQIQNQLTLFYLENGLQGFFIFFLLYSRMLRYIDPSKYPAIPNCVSVGSPVISEVLTRCQPRYHFAGSMVFICHDHHISECLL